MPQPEMPESNHLHDDIESAAYQLAPVTANSWRETLWTTLPVTAGVAADVVGDDLFVAFNHVRGINKYVDFAAVSAGSFAVGFLAGRQFVVRHKRQAHPPADSSGQQG